jgi:hypothetical protein
MHDSEQQDWKNRFNEASAASDACSGPHPGETDTAGPSAEQSAQAESAAECKSQAGQFHMPKPTFSTFVLSLASSALVQLGEVPDPSTGENAEDIALAKHSIDILSMLQDKVKHGLDAEETRLLEGLLYELRMKFIIKK